MKYASALLLLCISEFCSAQVHDLDRLMKHRFVNCTDIFYNSTQLIPEYHKRNDTDSMRMVVDYWEARCGQSEIVGRTKILFNIAEGAFSEGMYENLMDMLMAFKNRGSYRRDYISYHVSDDAMRLDYIADTYDQFTKTYAQDLLSRTDSTSLEYFICQFYTGNYEPLLSTLAKNGFPGTTLQRKYNEVIYALGQQTDVHLAMIVEYWMPMDKLKLLGNHPGIGFQMGYKKKRFSGDFAMIIRFINAKNSYSVYDKDMDSLFVTDHYLGAYMGADIGYELLKSRKSTFSVLGGIAYDTFDAVEENKKENIENVNVGTLNMSAGLGCRFYYKTGIYIGVQALYNVVDYNTKGGTDLSGHAVSLRLLWGMSGNGYRDYQLKALGRE